MTIGCQELTASLFGFGFQNEGEILISSCYIFKVSSTFVSCNKTFFCGWIWGIWELGLGQPLSTHTHLPFCDMFFFVVKRLTNFNNSFVCHFYSLYIPKNISTFFFPLYFQVTSKLEFCLVSLSLIYLIFIKKFHSFCYIFWNLKGLVQPMPLGFQKIQFYN